ncbi:MAG: elongation factor P--(R)-beta-lysine ligase [Sphaerochaetaceae bacterium]|nr:elongation factor P--(R)-beta-lysine ligase [Sphaerochaetaceae bacterium]
MYNFSMAKNRSLLYSNIRKYFFDRNYLEVETPTLSPDLIPEPTIDNFSSTFSNEFVGTREMYLIPSPEVFIKKLISQGSCSVFEISKCFRNSEQLGDIHNPEFTMLEYYTVDFDEKDSISLTQDLIRKTALPFCPNNVLKDFEILTVKNAVLKFTNLDLDSLQDPRLLRKKAEELGLLVPDFESWDDTFNRIFINFVEPNLPKDHPVCLTDYPYQIHCLAKREGNYRRRWELYINGVEIANCYLEETDPSITQDYYRQEYDKLVKSRSTSNKVIPDVDYNFPNIFYTFPKCSGVAIGLDRLLMVETNTKNIDDVLLFPFSTMLEQ